MIDTIDKSSAQMWSKNKANLWSDAILKVKQSRYNNSQVKG